MPTFSLASAPAAEVARRDAMVAAGKCLGSCGGGEPAADGLHASPVVQQPVDNAEFTGKLEHPGSRRVSTGHPGLPTQDLVARKRGRAHHDKLF